jgi:tetraacyldisaccharide 4'-kinase
MRAQLEKLANRIWYGTDTVAVLLSLLLWPLSLLVARVASRRHADHLQHRQMPAVPVVVVGNVTVGGTGKTPLVTAIVERLKSQGFRPAVISRGYGAHPPQYPYVVTAEAGVSEAGDEPLLIARATAVPVIIDPDRNRALECAVTQFDCDVVISDDGLQHYALPRDIEIVVADGERGLGNGLCIPAGPLREPVARLQHVDIIVANGPIRDKRLGQAAGEETQKVAMRMKVSSLYPLPSTRRPLPKPGQTVHVVAGIGNPERAFASVRDAGFNVIAHPFADHHVFTAEELRFNDFHPVVMTEKDAVKCAKLPLENAFALSVKAELPDRFWRKLSDKLGEAVQKRLAN